MKKMTGAMAALLCASAVVAAAEQPAAEPRLGMNLAGPSDWSSELPFVDVFRQSRVWISQKEGAAWGQGPELALDEFGWVKKLAPGCFAETMLCTIQGGHYPGGIYTVLYDGEGQLAAGMNAKVTENKPGRLLLDVNASKGGFSLKLKETNPANPVRNIRVIMPGFETSYAKDPFYPPFLKRWQGFACYRFMDWMHTNGSHIKTWADRPTPQSATFSKRGVALELMIELCNRQRVAPWFCMPHLADDDFVRRFAQMVKERLDPKLKIFIEYSNEVWNGQFAQSRYAGEEGLKLKLGEKAWEAGWHYTAVRSMEIFKIWEDVFGGHDRFVRVLPSQAANSFVSKQILGFRDAAKHADALAIAPYITMCISPRGKLTDATVAGWTVEQVLDHAEQQALPQSIKWIQEQKKVADQYGLRVVAYEAGQHLVGVGGGENNAAMTKLFQAANRHPRMGALYGKYLDAWAANGGDLMCIFSSTGAWSKWGSWGLAEFQDSRAADYPKLAATLRWAKDHGQNVSSGE
jgi:hypothetical protein